MPQNDESEFEKLLREGKLDESKAKQGIIDMWNKGGGEQPVKVTPTESTDRQNVQGYITQEKYIHGETPEQMEKTLGLTPGELKNGATIYKLSETPKADQFIPEGYTQTPGGKPYEPGGKYPVGEGVPQWKLTEAVPAEVIGKVNYNEPWQGQSGTVKETPVQQSMNEESISKSVDHSAQQSQGAATATPEQPENVEELSPKSADQSAQQSQKVTATTPKPEQSDEPALKSVDHLTQESQDTKTPDLETEQNDKYYQGYGY